MLNFIISALSSSADIVNVSLNIKVLSNFTPKLRISNF